MNKGKNYYVSKDEREESLVYFEYDKADGYKVNPKVKKQDEIEVSKIVFVNPELSEKIIRRKVDMKILNLLNMLKKIEENGDNDEGAIRRSIMDAEKLRLQIINNYVKYLGNTYQSLTLKKIQIILNQLRFKLYTLKEIEKYSYYQGYNEEKESRRGR